MIFFYLLLVFVFVLLALLVLFIIGNDKEIKNTTTASVYSFFDEYKGSTLYWSSAFIGSSIATLTPRSWRPATSVVAALVFFVPVFEYYRRNRPFGIYCEYRPTLQTGEVNVDAEYNLHARPTTAGRYQLNLMISSASHLSRIQLWFDSPFSTEIDFVDYPYNSQNFDDTDNIFTSRVENQGPYIVGIYIDKTASFQHSTTHRFQIREANTGKSIIEITLLP